MSTKLIEFHNDMLGGFFTTPLFWDCECDCDYIHPSSEFQCFSCGAVQEESPDSRVNEVFLYADDLSKTLIDLLREIYFQAAIPMPFAA